MTRAFIGLGGNAPSGVKYLKDAARKLRCLPGARLKTISPVYISEPLNCPGRQPEYYNCVIELQVVNHPRRLFIALQKTEHAIQRRRRRRNAPRRLDIDYLSHGNARLQNVLLTLPHPRMFQRAFVLLPLADIVGKDYTNMPNAAKLCAAHKLCTTQQLHRLP